MAQTDAMTDSFLAGQGIPVELGQVETELMKLWGPAAEQAGGPELENPHVTRIALANLVVESLASGGDSLCGVLDTVIAQFPCRAIVLRGSDRSGRRIAAEVSAVCHLPAPGMPQVCSERIVLRAGPEALDLVPGAVRPLLEAELPMFLWWTGDPRPHEALFRDLADECSRLILDLPDPGADAEALRLGLDPTVSPFSRDIAWFGLTRWRELIAQFFDPPCPAEALGRVDSVHIVAFGPEADRTPRIAIWLAAWLAGQLGWEPQGRPALSTSPSETAIQAEFVGPHGPIAVRISTRPDHSAALTEPRLMGVTITTKGTEGRGADRFVLVRPAIDSTSVRVDAETADSCRLPRLVEAPELDPARRIAAALESSRSDPPFQNALPIALWLLEQGG
jgi:glucose-6-phosphate dehydrogenase assembly protein OpcA